ncbi:MAG TPA: flagellar biosynthesis protein FlgM [Chromatiales bacterium]|nr:flagellar biosynthesis protein FlgM [Chromatiales bacterium]
MKWRTGRRSSNIEDRRQVRLGGTGRIGLGGLLIALLVGWLFGVDPAMLLQLIGGGGGPVTEQVRVSPEDEERMAFVSVVLADTEDTWAPLFQGAGRQYAEPKLVLYRGAVQSACGFSQAAMGPFYCPADQKVYLDLSFFDDLQGKLGAHGDFAMAYVIAHEIGHHVQNLLGILPKVQAAQQRASEVDANRLLVRLELQADCYSGIWAHHAQQARNVLEEGDIEEAVNAAGAVGDDRLQRRAQGYVVPDSFTHGTSEQRAHWFRVGFETGSVNACDTFGQARP